MTLSSSIPHLFIAGLGNLPYPITRHRLVFHKLKSYFHYLAHKFFNSIGQLVIDALASRLGIRMSSDRAGFSGRGNLLIGDTTMTLTLFKSSTRHSLAKFF
jgi:PTH1 family peptidyl-tRNA hydrolase